MIRPARASDAADLGALEVELFDVGAWAPADLLGTEATRWVRVWADGEDRAAAYVVTTTAGDVVDLLRIGVRPDHQRNGLGGLLLTAAVAHAREQADATAMMLEVSATNTAAAALYAAHGFGVIDRRRRYYPDGSDALVLSLDLGALGSGP